MTRPYLTPIPAMEPHRTAIASAIPVLETERLILRAPQLADWPELEPIWRTERGRFIGGPFDEDDAWLDFTQAVASWVLRGIGYWTVTAKTDRAVLGLVGIGMEIPDPEPELGWLLTEAAEGQGIGLEAATAVRDYAFAQGLPTCISFIDPANARSVALAERLGARRDPDVLSADAPDLVYRHTVPGAA
ncbi:MAG: GNAT family N-acetyltransferase [Rhodobacter sp.]|nr:GNAT family N-acetyltransferase [Rhodobacter sp.]